MNRMIPLLGLTTLLAAGTAQAGHPRNPSQEAVYDYARVVKVVPVVRQVRQISPHRECWQEQVVQTRPAGQGTAGATIVGGVIGGLIGHQFGSGHGRDAMTAVGAVIGSAIGRDAALQQSRTRPVSYPVERCETREEVSYYDRIEAYQVSYRYQGHEYTTRMPYDPGKRVKVQVQVRPVAGER